VAQLERSAKKNSIQSNMKMRTLSCWLFSIGATVVMVSASDLDQNLNKASNQPGDRDLSLIAKSIPASPAAMAQVKARVLKADQDAITAQIVALDAKIKQLNAQRESLDARQKEIGSQLLEAQR
jgi:peptidoglycan hydrolase CwlO-like protein